MLGAVRPVTPKSGGLSFPRRKNGSRSSHIVKAPRISEREEADQSFLSFPRFELLSFLERKVVERYKALFDGIFFGLRVDIYA